MKNLILLCTMLLASTVVSAQLPGMGGAGDLLGQFTKDALADDAMKPEFMDMKKGFIKDAKKLTDAASIGTHVNKLMGFIKPGMFKEGVDVNQLMDAANSVKSIAEATGVMKKLQDSLLPKAFKGSWAGKKQDAFNAALDALG